MYVTLVGHSCRTPLWGIATKVSKNQPSYLQNEHFARDFLQKSHVKTFRTRLLPKFTRQVSKTSVSYETSSKTHASSLQNKRFVRDFLQKSRVKSPRVSVIQGAPQECTRVSHKGFRKECVLQKCPTKMSPTRVSKIV